jgi:hypothetical protein
LEDQPLDRFVDRIFLRLFTRHPTAQEKKIYVAALTPGYATRLSVAPTTEPAAPVRRKYVAWSNHMKAEANSLRLEEEAAARAGDPATTRLEASWRQRCEDVIWALLNAPELTAIL